MKEESRQLLFFLRMVVRREEEECALSEADWVGLMKLAMAQAVPTLVLDGLQQCLAENVECKHFDEEIGGQARQMQWVAQMMATERLYA